jgi:hypothetical protein
VKGKFSETLISASGQRKIMTAIRRGWAPGAGGVRRFIRKRKPQPMPLRAFKNGGTDEG